MEKKNRQKKPPKKNLWYYLMPKHMMGDITGWGFRVTWKDMAKNFIAYSIFGIGCGIVSGLDFRFVILMVLVELLFVPMLIVNNYHRIYEQNRFDDVNAYMEQMMYSFQERKKIIYALDETMTQFDEDNPMCNTIKNALYHIMHGGNHNPNVQAEALAMIEAQYPVSRLHTMHQFLLKIESIGGDFTDTLNLLLEDRATWERRTIKMLNTRKMKKSLTTTSIVFAMAIGVGFSRLVVSFMGDMIDTTLILHSIPSQIATLIMWGFMLVIYLVADNHAIYAWDEKKETKDEALIIKRYHHIVDYDKAKEQKISLLYAIVPAILTIVLLIFGQKIWAIMCLAITVVMLNQHTIGYRLAKKAMIEEIEESFPQWLMEMALLLQTDNVQVSLYKSYDSAPVAIKPALDRMYKELEEKPTSQEPYNNFLKEFDVKGIRSTMKMLYAIYNGSGSDANTQITNILRRNNELLDITEERRIENSLSIYTILFLLPSLGMAVKLLTDMVVLLLQLGTFMRVS